MRDLRRLLVLGALLAVGCGTTSPTGPDQGQTPESVPSVQEPTQEEPDGSSTEGVMGEFVGAGGHTASGGLALAIEDGQARLELASDFTVQAVPGPGVYLNTTNDVHTGRPHRVAPLKQNSGSQQYSFTVPDDVRYTWVLIWCEPFDVPVAEASIPATP